AQGLHIAAVRAGRKLVSHPLFLERKIDRRIIDGLAGHRGADDSGPKLRIDVLLILSGQLQDDIRGARRPRGHHEDGEYYGDAGSQWLLLQHSLEASFRLT